MNQRPEDPRSVQRIETTDLQGSSYKKNTAHDAMRESRFSFDVIDNEKDAGASQHHGWTWRAGLKGNNNGPLSPLCKLKAADDDHETQPSVLEVHEILDGAQTSFDSRSHQKLCVSLRKIRHERFHTAYREGNWVYNAK